MTYTNHAAWHAMTDAERLIRVQMAQRVSSALGPNDRPLTQPTDWARMTEDQQRGLLLDEENECRNRRGITIAGVPPPTRRAPAANMQPVC